MTNQIELALPLSLLVGVIKFKKGLTVRGSVERQES